MHSHELVFAILLPLRLQDYFVTDFQIVKERIVAILFAPIL